MRTQFLIITVISAVILTGCKAPQEKTYPQLDVKITGDGQFPEKMAGKWKSNLGNWEFFFKEDGVLEKARIYWGAVYITPGQKAVFETRGGGESVWEPGKWTIDYDKETRFLNIRVVMDHIKVEMGNRILTGSTEDILSGYVTEDYKFWNCSWFNLPSWDKLPVDHDTVEPIELKFVKLGD